MLCIKLVVFRYTFVEASDKEFGVKQADGSWSGVIGMVAAKVRIVSGLLETVVLCYKLAFHQMLLWGNTVLLLWWTGFISGSRHRNVLVGHHWGQVSSCGFFHSTLSDRLVISDKIPWGGPTVVLFKTISGCYPHKIPQQIQQNWFTHVPVHMLDVSCFSLRSGLAYYSSFCWQQWCSHS